MTRGGRPIKSSHKVQAVDYGWLICSPSQYTRTNQPNIQVWNRGRFSHEHNPFEWEMKKEKTNSCVTHVLCQLFEHSTKLLLLWYSFLSPRLVRVFQKTDPFVQTRCSSRCLSLSLFIDREPQWSTHKGVRVWGLSSRTLRNCYVRQQNVEKVSCIFIIWKRYGFPFFLSYLQQSHVPLHEDRSEVPGVLDKVKEENVAHDNYSFKILGGLVAYCLCGKGSLR